MVYQYPWLDKKDGMYSIHREGLTLRKMEISSMEEVGMQRMWVDILVVACGNFLLIASISQSREN